MKHKFVFITPYLKWHGTGYLDVILQGFDDSYGTKELIDTNLCKTKDAYEMYEKCFGDQDRAGQLTHLKSAVYLLPSDYQDEPDTHIRWKEFLSEKKQSTIKASIKDKSKSSYQSLKDLKGLNDYLEKNEYFPDYQWLKQHWRHTQDLWHIINNFTIKTQVDWYKDNSMVYKNHSEKIKFITLKASYQDLESEEFETTNAIHNWLMQNPTDDNTYINLWGTQTTCQMAFHYLAWALPRLNKSKLIKCKSVKVKNRRIPDLKIEFARKELLSDLVTLKSINTLSPNQKDVVKWLQEYKEWGDLFTILLLGPRGCGKTKSVNETYGKDGIEVINCAQFQSNPEFARSELFGHKKGAFTGALKNNDGAFKRANDKVLFLDEIHHLDRATQTMLLTALQTDDDGLFTYTPLGADKPEKTQFQLIVATNLTHGELKEKLPADLLDRISQRILEFDPISPGPSVLEKFNNVWNKMDFKGKIKPINPSTEDKCFTSWLTGKERTFHGNYRDLETIAILCADYQRGKKAGLIEPKVALVDHVAAHTNKFWQQKTDNQQQITIEHFLDKHGELSLAEMTNEFKAKIVRAAELHCGDLQSASKMLGLSRKALIDIKKRHGA